MRIKRELLLSPNRTVESSRMHIVSRVVDRRFIFKDAEREFFVHWMHRYAKFCGVQVLAYCVMSNHFHILVEIPPKNDALLPPQEFLDRVSEVSSSPRVQQLTQLIEPILDLEGENYDRSMRQLQEPYLKRMHDVSVFVKELKQHFTQWYNKKNARVGTLWEGRFKSVLLEGGFVTRLVAAYIDLNPVRAGMVSDPKDYRWCSYAAAVAGETREQQGLLKVMQSGFSSAEALASDNVLERLQWGEQVDEGIANAQRRAQQGVDYAQEKPQTWQQTQQQYRMFLAEEGESTDPDATPHIGENASTRRKRQRGFSAEEIEKILKQKGELSVAETLRCKVRYFTDGAVLGSRQFVDDVLTQVKENSPLFSKRKTAGSSCQGLKNLCSLRNLQKHIFG